MSAPRSDDESAPAASRDLLTPLDAVVVGTSTIVVDASRPVAAIATGDAVRFVTWPDAPRPAGAVEEAEVRSTPEGAWVVYRDASGDASPHRTAVHLTPGGVTAAVDLGLGRPVGADASGLWIGDPRDASEWMGTFPGTEDLDAEDEDEDGTDLDPSTLPWVPETSFWPDRASWTEPVDGDEHEHEHELRAHVAGDGDESDPAADDDDGDDAVGWTLTFGRPHDVDDLGDAPDASIDLQPGDPSPTPPTDLVLVSPVGERCTIRVDHLVEGVRRDGGVMTLSYYAEGPRQSAPGAGGWVVYEPREVRVDVTDGLPDGIDTDELPWQPAPEPQEEDWQREVDRREEALAPWRDRLDLAGVEGAHWPLAPLDQASLDAAVAALRTQFERLDEPHVVWTREHPELRRGRSPYRAVEVDTVGSWPTTEILVSFEHVDVPYLRLRRRYRVFDDTGYPLEWLYVTVHLDEDIATRQLPARSEAVDGVLDI